jgi:hypothetical protein
MQVRAIEGSVAASRGNAALCNQGSVAFLDRKVCPDRTGQRAGAIDLGVLGEFSVRIAGVP